MGNKREIIAGNERVITQLQDLLQQLNADAYTHPLEALEAHTLGQHFRHVLEFYQCLLNGGKGQVVDYSTRKRDLLLETRPDKALQSLSNIRARLSGLDTSLALKIRADLSPSCTEERELCGSTLGRELMYVFDHAVHHLAIIRIGLRSAFPHIPFQRELGVAPGTLRHQKAS